MDYGKLFERAFGYITEKYPCSDHETAFRNVTERAGNMKTKKIKNKKSVVIAVSAAAAAAMTVSAGAALNWDFNTAFGELFSRRNDGLPDTQVARFTEGADESAEMRFETAKNTYTAYGFDYEKYGKELDLTFDCDGFTVDYKGMMGEGRVMYLLFDVIFDEDTDYAPKEGYTDWEPVIEYDTTDGVGREMDNKLLSVDGNRYSYYGLLIGAENMEGKDLTVKGYGLNRRRRYNPTESERYFENLNCDFYAEIQIDTENEVPRRTIGINEPLTAYDLCPVGDGSYGFKPVETVLYDITISPFTCSGNIETYGRVFEKADAYSFGSFVFTFSDGTALTETNVYSEDSFFFEFDRPVEPDDIVSVTIGEKTIMLK